MKRTATIEIKIKDWTQTVFEGLFLSTKTFPISIFVKIELHFFEHSKREIESDLIYAGFMNLNRSRLSLFPDKVFEIILPDYVNNYSLPENTSFETRKGILRKAHTILLRYQEKGWDIQAVSLAIENLSFDFSDTYRKKEIEAGEILLETYLVTTFETEHKGEVFMEGSSKYKLEGQMQIGQVGDNNSINELTQKSNNTLNINPDFTKAIGDLLTLIENSSLNTAQKMNAKSDVQLIRDLADLEQTTEVKELANSKIESIKDVIATTADMTSLGMVIIPIIQAVFQ